MSFTYESPNYDGYELCYYDYFSSENVDKPIIERISSEKLNDTLYEVINVFTKTAILTLINKDLEDNEVEIAFNIETFYELECVNNIINLLSTDIMNMSEVS